MYIGFAYLCSSVVLMLVNVVIRFNQEMLTVDHVMRISCSFLEDRNQLVLLRWEKMVLMIWRKKLLSNKNAGNLFQYNFCII